MTQNLDSILAMLTGVTSCTNGYLARCPAHDDSKASLSISTGDDGRILLFCHAGCSYEKIRQALGLKRANPTPRKRKIKAVLGEITDSYEYRDESKQLLFVVDRYSPKDFRQRRPKPGGGWFSNIDGVRRVLYRLPELREADPGAWTFLCEGEKDVENLRAQGAIATTCPGGACKWHVLSDDSALNGRRIAILIDKDEVGERHGQQVAHRLFGRAADLRVVKLPGAGNDVSDWLDAGGTLDQLSQIVSDTPAFTPDPNYVDAAVEPRERPRVIQNADEHIAVEQTLEILSQSKKYYQRGSRLVILRRESVRQGSVGSNRGGLQIESIPAPHLRHQLTRMIQFGKIQDGVEVRAHPSPWLIKALTTPGELKGIRPLWAAADAPFLRPDGSICSTPGYDDSTGIFLDGEGWDLASIPKEPSIDDARAAADILLDVVGDFPFESAADRSTFLAAFLTPIARPAFPGPSPLYLINGNLAGTGKSKLTQVISYALLGREMPVIGYLHDSTEMSKLITSIGLSGDTMALLDNLEGPLGNAAMDRLLTSLSWKNRLLNSNDSPLLTMLTVWFATGNNVVLSSDTGRRVLQIRLISRDEHPEERSDFKRPDLIEWVRDNRMSLVNAGLTMLSAFIRSKQTVPGLTPFGSFEGWSGLVRQAIVWAGYPDPCLTRRSLFVGADTSKELLRDLMSAWADHYGVNRGILVNALLRDLYPQSGNVVKPTAQVLKSALEALIACPPGKSPSARQIGNQLAAFRDRPLDQYRFELDPQRRASGRRWRLAYNVKVPAVPEFTLPESQAVAGALERPI